jgi:uncharacterized protein (DUF302 family)
MCEKHLIVFKIRKDYEVVLQEIYKMIEKISFIVLSNHNIGDIIKKKYNYNKKLNIIEFCNPALSKQLLDINMTNSVLIPCKISIYNEDQDKDTYVELFLSSSLINETEPMYKLVKKVEDMIILQLKKIYN